MYFLLVNEVLMTLKWNGIVKLCYCNAHVKFRWNATVSEMQVLLVSLKYAMLVYLFSKIEILMRWNLNASEIN